MKISIIKETALEIGEICGADEETQKRINDALEGLVDTLRASFLQSAGDRLERVIWNTFEEGIWSKK
jgi:hypothetical protein